MYQSLRLSAAFTLIALCSLVSTHSTTSKEDTAAALGDLSIDGGWIIPCVVCEYPDCNIESYSSNKSLKEQPLLHTEEEVQKKYAGPGIVVAFDHAKVAAAFMGTLENTYALDIVVSIDSVVDISFLDSKIFDSGTLRERGAAELSQPFKMAKVVQPKPIYLISTAGKTCHFSLYPKGLKLPDGKVTAYYQDNHIIGE
jgi:hypothetical protein